ncbi:hypothetical protein [Cryobacterium luteum]|uniref:RiboL-PSP-HEPN domain-containing protein n=1 Tax=Cryobacterium luteum TaxID=1424661 RepID=A0A5F0CZY1_9MICO|nr:hypothetical protein [Cryobacterium luteum]TFB83917.1 hypothetical protein E3O10_16690 [Cryobacterium luteum]
MSFLSHFTENEMLTLTRSIHRSILSAGYPGIQDLSEESALGFVRYFIEQHPDVIIEKFSFATSYTVEILEQARKFAEDEKFEFASMFYSTWIEHTLNALIAAELRFQGKADGEIESVIRANSLKKKMTSGWISVFAASFGLSKELVERILRLAEVRNEFAHYKWRASQAQDPVELHDDARTAIGVAESVVGDLSRIVDAYTHRHAQVDRRGIEGECNAP